MREEIYEIDIELSNIRRRINRAERGGLSRSEAEALRGEAFRLLNRAKKANYIALGLRAVQKFATNPYIYHAGSLGYSNSRASERNNEAADYVRRVQDDGGETTFRTAGSRAVDADARVANVPDQVEKGGSSVGRSSKSITSVDESLIKHGGNTKSAVSGGRETTGDPNPRPAPTFPKPSDLSIKKKNLAEPRRLSSESRGGMSGSAKISRGDVAWAGDSYRTFLTAAEGVEFNEILRVIQEWIDSKNLGVSVRQDEKSVPEDGKFVAETQRVGGQHKLFKLHLVESQVARDPESPTYSTTIIVRDGNRPWIWIDIRNNKRSYVNVPRIANMLMGRFRLYDGKWRMRPEPSVLGENEVSHLIEALGDASRRAPLMLVGATGDSEFQQLFENGLREWGREVFGIGGVAILDSLATSKFNASVPPGFNISPWSIRTFQPRLDFASPESASRHRFLGTSRLVEERPGRVSRILGDAARAQVSGLPVPKEVLDALHQLEMASDRKLLNRIRIDRGVAQPLRTKDRPAVGTARHDPEGDIEELQKQLELVKSWLEIPAVTEEQLIEVAEALEWKNRLGDAAGDVESRITELQERIFELEDFEQTYEELVSEYDERMSLKEREAFDLSLEKVALQGKLLKYESADEAFADIALPAFASVPENMEDLGDRLADLEPFGVEFTGDMSILEGLSKIDGNGRVVLATWECLLVCVDYLRARRDRGFAGSMHDYLINAPDGYKAVSPGKHSGRETEATENQFGRQRIFPVPESVDRSGRIFMGAHFKLPKIGIVTPRIHYHFNHGNVEKIYIGYIGPHLKNQQTN